MNKLIKKSKRLKAAAKAKRANSRRLGLLKKIKIKEEQEYSANKEIKIPISFAVPIRIMNSASVMRRYAKKHKRSLFGKNPAVKIVSIFLIIALNWFGLKSIGNTTAYFNDTEASTENTFAAAKLDFSLNFLMSDGFRTQTQGGWGSKAHGNNPGAYRDDHFADAFVGGLFIGSEASEYYAHFSTSADIEGFLPAGGTAAHFTGNHEDDSETEAGVLAGQTAALALNIGFDNFDPDFSENEGKLGDFYANKPGSPCENMTAKEVLEEANLILSGRPGRFSPSEINECVADINEEFDGGLKQKITPDKSVWREINIIKNEGLNFQHILKIEGASGDAELCANLTLKAYLNGILAYEGSLPGFNYGPSVFSDSADKWKLFIGLPADASSGLGKKTCGLKYVVSGWQDNLPNGGFSDIEEIEDLVASGEWKSEDNGNGIGAGPIVLNEFLPNPTGDDYASKPNGEWVELYNNSGNNVDADGWYLYDSAGHALKISYLNSDNNRDVFDGGETIVPAHGWLVVYLDGKHKPGWLNNAEDDSIRLFNGPKESGDLLDVYYYEVDHGSIPENKSYARIPDGTGAWVDPIPTPGKTNVVPENIDSASAIPEETVLDSGVGDNAGVPAVEGLSVNGGEILNIVEGNIFDSFSGASADDTGVCTADNNASSGAIPDNNTTDTAITDNNITDVPDAVPGINADSSVASDTVNDAINNPVDSAAGAGAENVSVDSNSASNNVDPVGDDSNEPASATESIPETTDVSPLATAGEQASPDNKDNSSPYTDVSMEIRQENPPAVEEEPLIIEEPSVNEEPMPQSSDTNVSVNDNSNNIQSDAVQN